MREPAIHSHITDCLPDNHSLAYQQFNCIDCHTLIHAGNNECMETWVETGVGNLCLSCFTARPESDILQDAYGLSE